MKKSLSLLLSIALVFGLFASMASAAETVELTVAQKYQALKDKGILKGTTTGSDGLDDKLTRAQFATIAIALADLAPATEGNTFSDVNNKQWWYGAIEAAAKAGLVEGSNGKFDPKGDVTVEQVIVIAARILKLTEVKDAKVEGASAWAAGYIQAAIDSGLTAARTDYTKQATRGQAIEVGYTAYVTANPDVPEKVSVTSAKATGVKKVAVTLDKEVDATKATFTIKKGNLTVAHDNAKAVWSEDKKTVTLAVNNKINEGEYTVTLAGVDSTTIDKASASFTAVDETVNKIEFATTSDEIANSTKSRIKVRAENQYGELASFQAANYTVTAATDLGAKLTRDDEGNLYITLNTKVLNSGGTAAVYTPGLSQIPVYIYFNGSNTNAQKTFKLGFDPYVTKMEATELKYNNGKTSLVNKGDTATSQITLLDQYGNPLTISQIGTPVQFHSNVLPYSENIAITTGDFDNDDEYEARVTLSAKEEKPAKYSVNLYAGASSQTLTFEVASSKVATKVDFVGFDGNLASGDKDVYIGLVAYDVNDEALTAQEIADNASRIKLSASGADIDASVVTIGPNKGKIRIQEVKASDKGFVFLQASIMTPGANSFKTYKIPVVAPRVASSLKLVSPNKPKAVIGGVTEFKIQVLDQHGDTVGSKSSTYGYAVKLKLSDVDNVTSVVDGGATLLANNNDVYDVLPTAFDALNDGLSFATDVKNVGSALVTAELISVGVDGVLNTADDKVIATAVKTSIQTLDPFKVELNYSLKDMGSLFAANDSGLVQPGQKVKGAWHLAKGVELVVKDNSGDEVAYPANIKSVSAENSNVALADSNLNLVFGNKAGDTTVTAVVYKADGQTGYLSTKVSVKADAVQVDKYEAKGSNENPIITNGTTKAYDLMDLKVIDQYGIGYKTTNIAAYDDLLGIRYTVTNISDGTSVRVDANTGEITGFAPGAGGKYQFVLTAQAPNGKATSTVIFKN